MAFLSLGLSHMWPVGPQEVVRGLVPVPLGCRAGYVSISIECSFDQRAKFVSKLDLGFHEISWGGILHFSDPSLAN